MRCYHHCYPYWCFLQLALLLLLLLALLLLLLQLLQLLQCAASISAESTHAC
jgi:hypothetical protein